MYTVYSQFCLQTNIGEYIIRFKPFIWITRPRGWIVDKIVMNNIESKDTKDTKDKKKFIYEGSI